MKSYKIWNNAIMLIMLFCVAVSFSSCSKDDDEAEKTYSVTLKDMGTTSLVTIDLTMFEYNETDEIIGTNTWDSVKENEKKSFTSAPDAVKVKIYIKVGSSRKWVQQVFYLKNNDTSIVIDGKTIIGNYEP